MSTTESAAAPEPQGQASSNAQEEGQPVSVSVTESTAVESEVTVELRRTVRIGRIITVCVAIGMVIAALASMSFPIAEEDQYTMAQIVGFMMLVGGAFGLAVGALVSLLLTLVARRSRGQGVAIQTDVR